MLFIVVIIDERGTSSHCSRCGKEVSRPVRGLVYCPFCNYTYHSDLTGAKYYL
ncbi:MAG: transposase [Candidatus Heimdallarchaeum endolithica]|uniref:Transposase n=1 Tax=Candidatus Heimdallarchaeum endolithica TaxID=2876572 RepID=A0A9Y1FN86_9ARCH|nr:MAG: transposase [Candidatus Heimdallarchaeum endolithica]